MVNLKKTSYFLTMSLFLHSLHMNHEKACICLNSHLQEVCCTGTLRKGPACFCLVGKGPGTKRPDVGTCLSSCPWPGKCSNRRSSKSGNLLKHTKCI